MFSVIIFCILLTEILADDTGSLKSTEYQQRRELRERPLELDERQTDQTNVLIQDLLKLLHEGYATNRKRSSSYTKDEEENLTQRAILSLAISQRQVDLQDIMIQDLLRLLQQGHALNRKRAAYNTENEVKGSEKRQKLSSEINHQQRDSDYNIIQDLLKLLYQEQALNRKRSTSNTAEKSAKLTNLKLLQREADNNLMEYELLEAKRAIDASCNDQLGKTRCRKYKKYGFCKRDYRLKKLCRKTCGFCGAMPKVPHCAETALGCCWDFRTPKKNAAGTNCPKCKDKPNKKSICTMFEPDCNSNKDAGSFMRKTCPRTCGVCGEGAACMDDPVKEMYCGEWSNEGMCETEKPMMSVYCRKTCGIC